jgi:hypothetical protein
MSDPQYTRRDALRLTAVSGLLTVGAAPDDDDMLKKDRQFVLAAGMTEAEADCWEHAARAAGEFFELPELHPMDRAEVASAIHVLQNKLLSRPTYRKYLDEARKGAGK